jgi:hypothetical protein
MMIDHGWLGGLSSAGKVEYGLLAYITSDTGWSDGGSIALGEASARPVNCRRRLEVSTSRQRTGYGLAKNEGKSPRVCKRRNSKAHWAFHMDLAGRYKNQKQVLQSFQH